MSMTLAPASRYDPLERAMRSTPSSSPLELVVNGRRLAIDAAPPHTTLLDFLREHGLTGAKEGCAEGECGSCAVALVVGRGSGSEYHAVNSCLMLLPMAADREFYTVESLAGQGGLSDTQQAMAAAGGSQCGYCTPGFVMSLFAEHYRPDRVGRCDPLALAGNLCRCTGYRPIRDAVLALGPPPPGRFLDRLEQPARACAPFTAPGFSRPSTINECAEILGAHPGARLIAGATDLGVESNLHGRRWPHLVSVEAIDELHAFSDTPERTMIGAAVSLTEIGRRWTSAPPAVHEWMTLFASPPIRNRATLGGNLATASPIGDAAPLLLALDATVHLAGPDGRRAAPLSSFFTGYRRTVLGAADLIAAIEVPKPYPELLRFYKISKRRLDDISTVAAAMALDTDAGGRVRRARFAFGGVAATPQRIVEAENAGVGQLWNAAAVERLQAIVGRVITPLSDHRGSKEYRLEVAKSLIEKFWWERQG
jgi:xanthine dehydrogenase small subunit